MTAEPMAAALAKPAARTAQPLRHAVLAAFTRGAQSVSTDLAGFSEREWIRNYSWLDSSGLALYLLDRLRTLECEDALPPAVAARLRQNLADNRARTAALFAESVAINHSFRQQGLLFANLKGITLWPDSVADPALRCQMDLDLLVRTEDAASARRILDGMGYLLYVASGDTWEFRAGTSAVAARKDLYKPKPQRTVDLHLSSALDGRLARSRLRSFDDQPFPVLSPVDLFLSQAHHLFHHITGAFTRAGWVLEYHRLVLAHADNAAFWQQVEERAGQRPQDALAIGVATLFTRQVFGDFAPSALTRWNVARLPAAVRLWVELYARRVVLADYPGTKLYLLLERELNAANPRQHAAIAKQYLPLHLPPRLTHSHAGERLRPRLSRYRSQLRFVLFRLRFHLVENLRYTSESSRWRRRRGLLHEDA
jgi:Uncharacterised nucleotidyltransferase